LLEGLEVSEVLLKDILYGAETLRLDSEYYRKKYLYAEKYIEGNPEKFIQFSELGLNVDGSAFYPALEPYYNEGEYPFIRVGDVKKYVDFDNCVKVPFEVLHKYPTLKHCKKGDIVLTKGGTIGLAGLITQNCCVTRDLIFINSSVLKEEDYICLYLFLSTNFSYNQLIRSSSQSVQPHLTITLVKNISLFKYSNQFKLTVSQLYKKSVELTEQSQTLYRQAEELLLATIGLKDFTPSQEKTNIKSFKESFLETGRLDAEYYQPKYEEIIKKIKSKNYTTIGTLFDILRGKNFQYIDESEIGVIKTKQVTRASGLNFEVDDYTSEVVLKAENLNLIENMDIVFASMGKGSLGKASLFYDFCTDKKFTIDSTLKIFRLKSNSKIQPEFIFVWLNSDLCYELILRDEIGSTGITSIYTQSISELLIPLVDLPTQQQISALIQESFALRKESERLLVEAKEMVEREIEKGGK